MATYRPEEGDLLGVVDALRAQGVGVLVTDDASPAPFDPVLRAVAELGVPVVRHRSNQGIARGLNEGLAFARSSGASWLLTVDQDSVVPPHLVADLLQVASSHPSIGVVGVETLDDPSGPVGYPSREADGLLVTEEVFQTCSLWSVVALDAIGGFDETLGIDGVDAAACLRLRSLDYVVALAPGTRIAHRYGEGRQVRVLGRTVVSTGHSPARRESMTRNRLALAPAEFRQSPRHAWRTLRRVGVNAVLGSTIEPNRWENTKGTLRGLLPRRGQ